MHTRRAIALALATAPLAVTAAAASAPDPVFAAIEAHRAAHARIVAYFAANTADLPDDLGDADADRLVELLAMTPTTPAGCAAMMRYIETYIREEDSDRNLFSEWSEPFSEPGATLLGRIAAVIEQAGA